MVNAVCGTSRGIIGTRRRPSMCHSELISGPAILYFNKKSYKYLIKKITGIQI